MKIGFPSLASPFVNPQTGVMASTWIQFFQKFLSQPGNIETITVTGSPFSYEASGSGSLVVSGGTVSSINVSRGTITFTTGIISGILPMSEGDIITVTYTVAPSITFIPG